MKARTTPSPPLLISTIDSKNKNNNTESFPYINTTASSSSSLQVGVAHNRHGNSSNNKNRNRMPIALSSHSSMTSTKKSSTNIALTQNGDGNYNKFFWRQSDFEEENHPSIYSYKATQTKDNFKNEYDVDCQTNHTDTNKQEPQEVFIMFPRQNDQSPSRCSSATSTTLCTSLSSSLSTISPPTSVFAAATDNEAGWRAIKPAASSAVDEEANEHDHEMDLCCNSALTPSSLSITPSSFVAVEESLSFSSFPPNSTERGNSPPPPTADGNAAKHVVTPTALYADRKRYRPSAPTPDHPKNSHAKTRMMLDNGDNDVALLNFIKPCLEEDEAEDNLKFHGETTTVPCRHYDARNSSSYFFRPIPICLDSLDV